MKTLSILLLAVILTAGRITAANSLGGSLSATSAVHFSEADIARIYIENWQSIGHPHAEYIRINDEWWQLMTGDTNGFIPLVADGDRVNTLISSILRLPVGELQYTTPSGLDLNSLDDTADTIGASKIDFCAQLSTVTGNYYAVCADRDTSGQLWLSVSDSIAHLSGWFSCSDDSAVIRAMHDL